MMTKLQLHWLERLSNEPDYDLRQLLIDEMSDDLPYDEFHEVCELLEKY